MGSNVIKHNPMLKQPIMLLLQLASKTSDARELETMALQQWEPSFSQSPATVMDVLKRAGALEITTFMNGEPYAGTLDDMQLDESVPDDAEVSVQVQVTETGAELLAAYAPEHTLAQLFEEKPHYAEVFTGVLRQAAAPGGATREALEAVVDASPVSKPDAVTGQTKVYPQYFIDALETAGGIRWDGAWRATEAGTALLAS